MAYSWLLRAHQFVLQKHEDESYNQLSQQLENLILLAEPNIYFFNSHGLSFTQHVHRLNPFLCPSDCVER